MDYLNQLAYSEEKTIIMTIHQPSVDILEKIDRLFLLVEGKLAYQGSPSTAVQYFENNFGLSYQSIENPANFLIDCTHSSKK